VAVVVGLALLLAVAEVFVFVEVAHLIGVLLAVVVVVVVSACGPWLVRRAGFGTWRRAQDRMRTGEAPGRELLDGVGLLVAGGLISVPGLITDAIGVFLLLPPVRAAVGRTALHRLRRRLDGRLAGAMGGAARGRAGPSGVGRTAADGRPVIDARSRPRRGRAARSTGPPDERP